MRPHFSRKLQPSLPVESEKGQVEKAGNRRGQTSVSKRPRRKEGRNTSATPVETNQKSLSATEQFPRGRTTSIGCTITLSSGELPCHGSYPVYFAASRILSYSFRQMLFSSFKFWSFSSRSELDFRFYKFTYFCQLLSQLRVGQGVRSKRFYHISLKLRSEMGEQEFQFA